MDSSALLQFERLIPDSVGMAMRAAGSTEFLSWVQNSLLDYVEEGIKRYEERHRERTMRFLKKTAETYGFTLTPNPQIQ